MDSRNPGWRARYKALRKKLLSRMPFVRRSRHERALASVNKFVQIERRAHEAMGYLFFSWPQFASTAHFEVRIPLLNTSTDELCLFATHASGTELKPHVVDHLEALLEANVAVILIANTDLDPAVLSIPAHLVERLHGCIIRQNVGYDFGAWAHAYSLIDPTLVKRRLYLINDSIVGPLDRAAYTRLLQRIRQSQADLVGLTSHPDPHDHLQSYYLVVNERLLHSELFGSFMLRVVNMPQKECVIDCYELWLTPFLQRHGFEVRAMFPNLASDSPLMRNDTLWHWRALIELGFPFVKSAVLTASNTAEEARRLLPARYLQEKRSSVSVDAERSTRHELPPERIRRDGADE